MIQLNGKLISNTIKKENTMSTETYEHLNTNILVGYTAQRGTAWHYKKELQGAESNHYDGAIPSEDIARRLFNWEAVSKPLYIKVDATIENCDGINDDGTPYKFIVAENRKAIVRSDNNHLFEIFTNGYTSHQYKEWLLTNLGNMIDDDINFGSAGLLKNGGVAFVSLEMPENVTVLEGFEVRPHLLATTSHNGRLATTYKSVSTFVVCDNTHSMAMAESGAQFKAKHSGKAGLKIQSAREALGLVMAVKDDIVSRILELSEFKVSENDFMKVLNTIVPKIDETDETISSTIKTRNSEKRNSIVGLYNSDNRVAPWKGSALGVLQAFNTYEQHFGGRDANRIERNYMNTLQGVSENKDSKVLEILGV